MKTSKQKNKNKIKFWHPTDSNSVGSYLRFVVLLAHYSYEYLKCVNRKKLTALVQCYSFSDFQANIISQQKQNV